MEFDIDLAIDYIDDFGDNIGSDVEIKTIEIENLHLESSEVRASVERAMGTLESYEDQLAEQECLDSLPDTDKKIN